MEKHDEDMQLIDYEGFKNPFILDGMNEALKRIISAVNGREKIVIYGQYNADGIAAISLLVLVLKYLNADVEYFIPDKDNSEISSIAVENYIKFLGASLMITVGCGTNSYKQVELCKALKIDVIITDHHKCSGNKPRTIVINPNDDESRYPYKGLTGAGVAYKLAQAIGSYYRMKSINKYLDIVMLGTIAAAHDLNGENKEIVTRGISHLRYTHSYGMHALMKVNDIDCENISIRDIKKLIRNLMPVYNPSRVTDNARIAVELLITSNSDRAEQIAKYLKNETKFIKVISQNDIESCIR